MWENFLIGERFSLFCWFMEPLGTILDRLILEDCSNWFFYA
ncbi:hypothetical protein EV05_1339 [Prochlorococcus sp. MIT 0601]|nr:hypothetical protein EV05_1339 [Prochlorococcus sp. MIT 0601]